MFRSDVSGSFGRRADALFELGDALLTMGSVPAPVHLSLAAPHRRGWGSRYAALASGSMDTEALRTLVARHPLVGGQPIDAIDVSVWPRCDAETSADCGYYSHASRHAAGQPIVVGWAYQWVAQLGPARDSWTAPLDVQRVHPSDNTNDAAVAQIRALVSRLSAEPTPLFVFDADYDSLHLALALDDTAAVLVRLRCGRCFYGNPPAPTGVDRPRRHGHKFACADPAPWLPPSDEHREDDTQYGAVRVRAWAGLHTKPGKDVSRALWAQTPVIPGTLILVEVSRLPGRTRKPADLWLWWHGPGLADLALLWRASVRRFDLEHTFRFLKQPLNWTTPRVRHPEQADRWTWLVLLAYTALRLTRPLVADHRLPWARP